MYFCPLCIQALTIIVFALNPAKGVVWQVNIIDQIRIDTFLNCFQFIFGRVDGPRPILAAIDDDILRLVLTLIALLIALVSFEFAVIIRYMFDHLRDITLRNPEDDVTEYVDSLDKHIKKIKRDVTYCDC